MSATFRAGSDRVKQTTPWSDFDFLRYDNGADAFAHAHVSDLPVVLIDSGNPV